MSHGQHGWLLVTNQMVRLYPTCINQNLHFREILRGLVRFCVLAQAIIFFISAVDKLMKMVLLFMSVLLEITGATPTQQLSEQFF